MRGGDLAYVPGKGGERVVGSASEWIEGCMRCCRVGLR